MAGSQRNQINTHIFLKDTIFFAEPQHSFFFFSDLNLNIFLKYSHFSRSALLLTVSEKVAFQANQNINRKK